MKDLEHENQRLKKLVADLSPEKTILKDVADGDFLPERRRKAIEQRGLAGSTGATGTG